MSTDCGIFLLRPPQCFFACPLELERPVHTCLELPQHPMLHVLGAALLELGVKQINDSRRLVPAFDNGVHGLNCALSKRGSQGPISAMTEVFTLPVRFQDFGKKDFLY